MRENDIRQEDYLDLKEWEYKGEFVLFPAVWTREKIFKWVNQTELKEPCPRCGEFTSDIHHFAGCSAKFLMHRKDYEEDGDIYNNEKLDFERFICIKACYEMDINTKHLTTWIPIEDIVDVKNAESFNGVVILTNSPHQEEYYIHDVTVEEFNKELKWWLRDSY